MKRTLVSAAIIAIVVAAVGVTSHAAGWFHGIELPLRMLVWNQGGQTIIGYNDPHGLAGAYSLTTQFSTLDAMSSLLRALANDAAGTAEHP